VSTLKAVPWIGSSGGVLRSGPLEGVPWRGSSIRGHLQGSNGGAPLEVVPSRESIATGPPGCSLEGVHWRDFPEEDSLDVVHSSMSCPVEVIAWRKSPGRCHLERSNGGSPLKVVPVPWSPLQRASRESIGGGTLERFPLRGFLGWGPLEGSTVVCHVEGIPWRNHLERVAWRGPVEEDPGGIVWRESPGGCSLFASPGRSPASPQVGVPWRGSNGAVFLGCPLEVVP
jgi:hypothetical protein